MNKRPVLAWADFFRLKKSRRNWERAGGLILGATAFLGSGFYFSAVKEFDPLEQPFGMDPAIVSGAAVLLSGAGGAFLGISGSSVLWRVVQKKRIIEALDVMEKDFYQRIAAKRPKQVKMNIQHPLPDYYGERIESLQDYRKWLRDVNVWCTKMGIPRS